MTEPADGERGGRPERAPTAPPIDPSRRQFFRRFAGDVLTTAAQVTAVVGDLRARSAAEAASLLGEPLAVPASPGSRPDATDSAGQPGAGAARGYRSAFRFQADDVLLVIDQRQLPEVIDEVPVRTAPEAASAIRTLVVDGGPAMGQVAAIGLALSARILAVSNPAPRRAALENAAVILRNARPTAMAVTSAVERLMDRFRAFGALSGDGGGIATAMHDEAMAIVAEAVDDHGRLAAAGQEVLPSVGERALRVLTHGTSGALASGQFGTALGVVQVAHAAERPLLVWVSESRPRFQGARVTAWELEQAGIPHTVIADSAAGPLIARGEIDVVLVAADRIAANGDTGATIGTYTLAALAQQHGVPFVVCAPLSSVDLSTPTGAGIPLEERPIAELITYRGLRLAPEGTDVRNPAVDVTPAGLISAIVTEEGVLQPPFAEPLAAAVEQREHRRREAGAASAVAV